MGYILSMYSFMPLFHCRTEPDELGDNVATLGLVVAIILKRRSPMKATFLPAITTLEMYLHGTPQRVSTHMAVICK